MHIALFSLLNSAEKAISLWWKIQCNTNCDACLAWRQVLFLRQNQENLPSKHLSGMTTDLCFAERLVKKASLPRASSSIPNIRPEIGYSIKDAVTLFMSGLAIGVWLAVAYTLSELPLGVAVMVDEASLELCALDW